MWWCLIGAVTRRRETGESEVVGCYSVGDLKIFVLVRYKIEIRGGSKWEW